MRTKAANEAPDGAAISGPLRPLELATGAVLGAVSVTLAVIASLVPFAAALNLLAAVPMGMVAQRHRLRALIAATFAAVAVAFVAGGLSSALTLVSCAVLGGIVGQVKRRGRGMAMLLGWSMVAAAGSALFAIATLLIFANTRTLFLDTIRDTMRGLSNLAGRQPALQPLADFFAGLADAIIAWWWLWVGGSVAFGVVTGAIIAWFVLGAVLDRLAWLPGTDRLDAPDDVRPVDPLPVRLDAVSFRYPGAKSDALSGIDLSVDIGEFVAVVGHNGSGKSTLTRILAGRPPTSGTVTRPGAAGLGRFGGTAVVLQRPETQTLGVLVADDVVWGLPPGAEVDIDGLLREVGLDGLGDRETGSLSGGQMQRLAVAAALARRPSLLIADEATAMVDPAGRTELVALLASLPARHRMAVVLVTHQESEAAAADRVIHLAGGAMVERLPDWSPARALPLPATPAFAHRPLLRLDDVAHTYLARTPWATEALHGVDLTVARGEGVLIVGGNGSGKSTLAWVIAGLIAPTSGRCELDGKPTTDQVGRVALAFQHARLQLQRRTVSAEIESWGGPGTGSAGVGRALDAVGLDRMMAGRSIDELSGGQARRVVLAGILVSHPKLVVLDEPLAGLDPDGRRGIVELLVSLRRSGLTLVVISHDVEELSAVCNRTVRLDAGRIVTAASDSLAGGVR
ncbi:DUF2232 domain-containing protein [Aldersonia sp. NBC_00410]|uniref:ABC transporter ATP-binding protein n=1 Tax=Aldersonia sp. NBC_00410 TaxID=2975954 RepID=UPI002257EFB0|nr:ATP-binding cassette domain-containing protein [Aldersonia sp. NBC_00410]MCX5045645.1 DUF2232 domain-containing protein [Aldersonia sp. NBC_00410]